MLDKFEKSITNIKNKLGQKKMGIIYFSIFAIIIFLSLIMLKQFKIEKQYVQDGYNRSMYDFVANVNNVENEILKLKVTGNDTYTLTTLASIFAKANSAKANLDVLPFSVGSTENVSKFLSQVSDFSYSLMRNVINGEGIEEYKEQIDSIYSKISDLSDVTEEIYNDLNSQNIKWDELAKVGDKKIKTSGAEEEISSANKIGKTFTEYEGIIYDGAFSEHVLSMKPSLLSEKEISSDECEDKLMKLFDIENITLINEQNGKLPLYVFDIKLKNENEIKTVYVTKQDGIVYQMIANRDVQREVISMDEAKEYAVNYINQLGIYDVKDTYYLKADNMATISFAGVQDGVIIYSDLIKVKVALDNGQILAYEANGYVYNHKERNITPLKSIEEARQKLYKDLNIESERLCIIPTDTKDEVLTYEFCGSVDDKKFLVYINANTLVHEKIYIVLETPGGIMTM